MHDYRLNVIGVPSPQGSKTAIRRGDKVALIEGGSKVGRRKHKAWRQDVAAAAHTTGQHVDPDAPLYVRIRFLMPKPKSRPKYVRWCERKPDLDKLVRSTLDGLDAGGLLRGDSRVTELHVDKVYATPTQPTGAVIHIRELSHWDVVTWGGA